MQTGNTHEPLQITTDSRGVCWLTLNRPQRANALNGELVQALLNALALIRDDKTIRLLVLSGQGNAFCGGADLQWMQKMAVADAATNEADALALATLLEQLLLLPKPVLARVNGAAYGGAIGLIAASDIAIACQSANFAFSEVRLGLVPAVIAPFVIAAIGLRQTRHWFLSGESFDAQQAQVMGLVHQQVEPERLDEAIEQQIQQLLMGAPLAQQQLKALFAKCLSNNPLGKRDCAQLLADIRTSAEAQEGLTAFFDKRAPRWQR